MDSADSDAVCAALRSQGSCLHNNEERLTSLLQEIQESFTQQQSFQSIAGDQFRVLGDQIQQLSSKMVNLRTIVSGPAATPVLTPTP